MATGMKNGCDKISRSGHANAVGGFFCGVLCEQWWICGEVQHLICDAFRHHIYEMLKASLTGSFFSHEMLL